MFFIKFIKCIHVSCSHTDILLFQLVKLITFLFENITLTTVSTVPLPVALNIHLLSSFSSVLSVFQKGGGRGLSTADRADRADRPVGRTPVGRAG